MRRATCVLFSVWRPGRPAPLRLGRRRRDIKTDDVQGILIELSGVKEGIDEEET